MLGSFKLFSSPSTVSEKPIELFVGGLPHDTNISRNILLQRRWEPSSPSSTPLSTADLKRISWPVRRVSHFRKVPRVRLCQFPRQEGRPTHFVQEDRFQKHGCSLEAKVVRYQAGSQQVGKPAECLWWEFEKDFPSSYQPKARSM